MLITRMYIGEFRYSLWPRIKYITTLKERHIVTNIKLYVVFEMAVQKYKNMLMHLSFKFHSRYTSRYI